METQLDKELYDIVKQRMKVKLPKILTQRKVDESLESHQVKNELRRRKKVRRQLKQYYNLDFKTSKFPNTYRANYYDQDHEQREQSVERADSVQKDYESEKTQQQAQIQQNQSQPFLSKMQMQSQNNLIKNQKVMEQKPKNMSLRELIYLRKQSQQQLQYDDQQFSSNQDQLSVEQDNVLIKIPIQKHYQQPNNKLDSFTIDNKDHQYQQIDDNRGVMRKSQSQYQLPSAIVQKIQGIKIAKIQQFGFDTLSREEPLYEKIDIQKILDQAKKLEKKKKLFKI